MDQLRVYLPQDRRAALARGELLPEHTHGAALFADISGFTPLTEALDRALGPRRGVETVTDQINRVYEALIAEVERYGGSVIDFAGDSIMCWFDNQKAKDQRQKAKESIVNRDRPFTFELLPSARSAVACALALQQAMRQFAAIALPDGTTTTLALKVAVAAGPARRFVVGDPDVRRFDVLAGAPLTQVASGEHLARRGEVLLDEATATALGQAIQIAEWRTDQETGERFAVLSQLQIVDFRLQIDPVDSQSPISNLQSEIVRPWLLPAVYERHQAGLGDFLTELRPAVALFLRFSGIDFVGDPAASAKLDTLIRLVQHKVTRYDGTLLQLTIGDKGSYLYVVFGAPTAHEDDARRTVVAALELRDMLVVGDDFDTIQVGISYGVMRVGAYGGPTRQTYGVLGDDVNLAARLMMLAAPGDVLISGRVQAALGAAVALEPRTPVRLKGKAEPQLVFAVMSLRRRAIHLEEPSYALPMVGRQHERDTIIARLDQVLAGHGQIVGITAEAGMGKSRLVTEMIHVSQQRGMQGYGGFCRSDGLASPYLVWEPIWQAFFDVDPAAPLRQQARALEGLLDDLAPERSDALPLLGPLLGLNLLENDFTRTLEPQFRQSALHALLVDCLLAVAREAQNAGSGMLLVLEDLHWIDAISHDLLEQIAHAIVDLPVLIVLAYRPPELLRLHAPRVEALPHFTRIALAPLSADESALVIHAKLAQLLPERAGTASQALIARVTERAQGNPFYVEELLNYLRDRGIDPHDTPAISALDLPASLHTLILSRIDQLGARRQATLKLASVIGRLFRFAHLHGAYPLLGAAERLKADLDELARLELTPLDTPEPELTYLFKHIVTYEVAYESLTAQTRAGLHQQLAAYLERLASDDTDRVVDLLAFHYERSDNLDKKRHYLRRAGEAAAARFANDAAVDYLTRALALMPEGDVAERYALLRLREHVEDLQAARSTQGQDVEALAQLAELLDDERRSEAAVCWSRYAERMGDYAQAILLARQAVTLAQQASHAALEGAAQFQLGWSLWLSGNIAAASAPLEQSLRLAHMLGDQRLESNVLGSMGAIARWQSDYAGAHRYYEQSVILARASGQRQQEGRSLYELGLMARELGEHTSADTYLQQSLRIFHTVGERQSEVSALTTLARMAYDTGDLVAAQSYFEQALQLGRATGQRLEEMGMLCKFGWYLQCMGDYNTARAYYEQCLSMIDTSGYHQYAYRVFINFGILLRNQGHHVEARAAFTRAVEGAQASHDQWQEGRALRGLGNVALDLGELDTAANAFEESVAALRNAGNPTRALEAISGLAAVALAQSDIIQAKAHAETILDYLAHGLLTTANTDEPLQIELICYRTLHALGDPRAPYVLESAYERLQNQAVRILDEAMRRSFLENVPYHREIVAAWTEAHDDE
jgi:class 3 adenylate cyclase/tetratricopeptide (TPR) repeat protein